MTNCRLSKLVARNIIARQRTSHFSHGIPLTQSDNGISRRMPLPAVDSMGLKPLKRDGIWTVGSVHWRASFSRHESTATDRIRGDVESKKLREAQTSSEIEPRREAGEKGITGPSKRDIEVPQENSSIHSSYWGISPRKITREDGSAWPWNSFRPWETYTANVDIDISKHHVPKTFLDKFAYWTVKFLRVPTDLFFQRRYGCRAMMLETVAAVPGMVGGMLLHCKSLRKFEHSGGWIKALLEEAENERMHLMTMVEIVQPKWYERALVLAVQVGFFNTFLLLYLVSPKLAHRIVGYLEEEAIHSYTEFLKEIDNGNIQNVTAPAIAIDYWRLPEDSNLRDVVMVIRADEAHHRDVNHFASDIHFQGKQLHDAPAPIGYH